MVRPTIHHRLPTLDVLRGLAVLGILLANISAFSGPSIGEVLGETPTIREGGERIVEALTVAFVNGKFRSMLAVLFGVGLWLQFSKRSAIEGAWPGGYLKRNLFLGILGLFHLFLIWSGDILFIYSVVAFFACWFAKWQDRTLKIVIGALFGLAVILALASVVFAALVPDSTGSNQIPDFLKAFSAENELRVFQQGTYFEQFKFRSIFSLIMVVAAVTLIPMLLPLFLIGILLGRIGYFSAPSRFPATQRLLLSVGLGIGLAINIAFGVWHWFAPTSEAQTLAEVVGGPVLALGYLGLGAALVDRLRTSQLPLRLLENVGRVALTVYLLQSVLTTTFFYSWGGGFFGKTTRITDLIVVASVWAIVILFANLWTRKFAIGPVEWLWRSATEGRPLPLLKPNTEASLPLIPATTVTQPPPVILGPGQTPTPEPDATTSETL